MKPSKGTNDSVRRLASEIYCYHRTPKSAAIALVKKGGGF